MFRDIEMENLASAVFDNEKAVQHAKSQSRHGEEVHGRDDVSVIAEESRPELAGVVGRRPVPEIAGDGALGNVRVIVIGRVASADIDPDEEVGGDSVVERVVPRAAIRAGGDPAVAAGIDPR